MNLKKIAASIAALGAVTFAHAANVEFYGSIGMRVRKMDLIDRPC